MEIEFSAEWQPRDTDLMRLADALGKDMAWDSSQWSLCPSEARRIQRRYARCMDGRLPTIDGMADPENAKAPLFISRELTIGCAGVDFFANLGMMAGRTPAGEQHLVWLNGDFSRMTEILTAIIEYRIDAIVIFPCGRTRGVACWTSCQWWQGQTCCPTGQDYSSPVRGCANRTSSGLGTPWLAPSSCGAARCRIGNFDLKVSHAYFP